MLLGLSFVANAQTVKPAKKEQAKPFKVAIGGGYASPANTDVSTDLSKAGFVYKIEPQYELSRNLEVGLRFEQALIQRPEALDNNLFYASKAKSIMSAALTANYIINTGTAFRPYVGAGAGLYYSEKSEQTYQTSGSAIVYYPLPATVVFGGLARAGVKFGIVYVEADYNLISDTSVTNAATKLTLAAKNSYFSVKAGITIGGSH